MGQLTVGFSLDQYAWIVREAERLKVSMAEVVRRIVENTRNAKKKG